MKLLITGASGFVGQYVVAEALRKGHQVSAVVRLSSDTKKLPWVNHPAVELIRIDLRHKAGIVDALQGVDAVIHLAAAKEGDFYTRFAGTVIATENLLDAMLKANIMRLINISTFSVYDYLRIPSKATIDENSAIESNPLERDEYAQTKLLQEELVNDFQKNHPTQITTIRPGLIYGRGNTWSSLLGGELAGNLWLRIGAYATMPLTYIENCADAIICAVESEQAIGQIINIVDDNLPTQRTYVKKLKQYKMPIPKTIPVNWTLMRSIAWTMWKYNKVALKGQAKLPGIFNPVILDARFKHFRFTNTRAKEMLNWKPKYSLDTALDRINNNEDLLTISESITEGAKTGITEENLCGLPT
ncbi:MAG: NAD(P)-dependent oxidoreductase [Methylacidiphilales bacterium]|nr:NAD(P)-dependent oxidoreductase [Candidatus Methylacidiphilales bacterium]NJR18578.1 NAD(P)-dependent oxidoreductase [Calothrix sp. CSU_2_0]